MLFNALDAAVAASSGISALLVFPRNVGAVVAGSADVAFAVHTANAAAASSVVAALQAGTAALLNASGAAAGSSATLVGAIDRAVVATFRATLPPLPTPRVADAAAAVVAANISDAVAHATLAADFPALQVPTALRQGPEVDKVLSVLDPSRPPPAAAPRRMPPPPAPPPPAPGAYVTPPYVGNLSKMELSAAIIGAAVGFVALCVATALCACMCYRRGRRQAEALLEERKLHTIVDIRPPNAPIQLQLPPNQLQKRNGMPPPAPSAAAAPPARRASRPSAGASGTEITPAATEGSSPRVSAASSEASAPRLSSQSRRDVPRASAGGGEAAAARVSASLAPPPEAMAEPLDTAAPVAQPPAWATSSFDNPLTRHEHDAEMHEQMHEEPPPQPQHAELEAVWHALGGSPEAAPPADGRNPLFDGGGDVAEATPTRWEALAAQAATPGSASAASGGVFASPDDGGGDAFATPGSVFSAASGASGRARREF